MSKIKNAFSVLEKQKSEINQIEAIIKTVQHRKFYGKITLEFKNGMIDLITKAETIKPSHVTGD